MAETEIKDLLPISSESIPWPGAASLDFYGVNSAKANTGNPAYRRSNHRCAPQPTFETEEPTEMTVKDQFNSWIKSRVCLL